MTESLKEILEYIEKIRTDIKNYTAEKKSIDLSRKIDVEFWSPAEILQHLYKTEIYITELLVRQLARAKKKNMIVVADISSYLNSLDELEIEKGKEKIKAPEIALPDESVGIDTILKNMDNSRIELNKVLDEFSKYDMAGIKFPHPTGRRLNMIQWILFLGKHEERHFNQIKLILK